MTTVVTLHSLPHHELRLGVVMVVGSFATAVVMLRGVAVDVFMHETPKRYLPMTKTAA